MGHLIVYEISGSQIDIALISERRTYARVCLLRIYYNIVYRDHTHKIRFLIIIMYLVTYVRSLVARGAVEPNTFPPVHFLVLLHPSIIIHTIT